LKGRKKLQFFLEKSPQICSRHFFIDAVVMQRAFRVDRKAWPTDDNEQQLHASTKKLLDLVERAQVKLVVFGHDGVQWSSLKISPEYYE